MKIIITEKQNFELRRRIYQIDKLLDVLLDNMHPCDYSYESQFYAAVILEFETLFDLTTGIERVNPDEVIDYVKKTKKEYIRQYFINSQEDC
jgi:hypothetical protein